MAPLTGWHDFYVILGSAAGALTGLQFIVITLIVQSRSGSQSKSVATMREIRAFGTPTVVHFCTALLISALMTVPWHTLAPAGVSLGVCGVLGTLYSITIFWHAHKAVYNPDLEDWIWYTALPFLAHLGLIAGGVLLWSLKPSGTFTVAADALLFLLLGIHNSWDTVTYVAVQHRGLSDNEKDEEQAG